MQLWYNRGTVWYLDEETEENHEKPQSREDEIQIKQLLNMMSLENCSADRYLGRMTQWRCIWLTPV